jgi:hypothetical protein
VHETQIQIESGIVRGMGFEIGLGIEVVREIVIQQTTVNVCKTELGW